MAWNIYFVASQVRCRVKTFIDHVWMHSSRVVTASSLPQRLGSLKRVLCVLHLRWLILLMMTLILLLHNFGL